MELCDACGVASALYLVTLPSGRVLFMCSHHYKKHFGALVRLGCESVSV